MPNTVPRAASPIVPALLIIVAFFRMGTENAAANYEQSKRKRPGIHHRSAASVRKQLQLNKRTHTSRDQ